MNKYEVMFIVKPAEEEATNAVIEKVEALIARAVAARYHTDSIHDAEVERFSSLFCKTLRHKGLPER